jgi:hypothetical protein
MARLMVVPIRNRGDSILIVTHQCGRELTGFITRTTLAAFFRGTPSICDCMSFVEQNLDVIELTLLTHSELDEEYGSARCIELALPELEQAIGLTRP